jgi:hypothetical protein
MTKKLQLILTWLAFAGLSSCLGTSGDPAAQRPYATIAVMHAAPDGPPLNIFIDDVSLSGTASVFRNYTGYFFLDPGVRTLKAKAASDGTVLINAPMVVEELKSYTAFLITVAPSTFQALVVEDVGTLSSLDKCMARFVHLSPDAPKAILSIVENGISFPAKSYKEISTFTEMEPKALTLELRAESDGQLILTKAFTPQVGAFYTISLVGFKTLPPANSNQLELVITKI